MLLQEVDDLNFAACSPSISTYGANSDHYMAILEQGPVGLPLEESSSLTVSQKQKFTIHEISPEWGYAHEATKVSVYLSSKNNGFIVPLFFLNIIVTHQFQTNWQFE